MGQIARMLWGAKNSRLTNGFADSWVEHMCKTRGRARFEPWNASAAYNNRHVVTARLTRPSIIIIRYLGTGGPGEIWGA